MGKSKSVVSFPWEFISVNIIGPLIRSILVVSDYLSKYVLLHPMRDSTSNPVCKFLEEEIFLVYSVPPIITVDNATIFN